MPPRALLIAGPNGAGKTTFAREFLPAEGDCLAFVNADLIAAGLSPFDVDAAAMQASRLLLQQVRDHVAARRDFAVETTLAGRAYVQRVRAWRAAGYQVKVVFLRLPSAELAVARVARRVQQGGHAIPEPVIRRRFTRGHANFERLFRPHVDCWQLYDAGAHPPVRIAEASMTEDQKRRHPDMAGTQAAMIRAARRAREVARLHGTPLVLWRDGQVVEVMPGERP